MCLPVRSKSGPWDYQIVSNGLRKYLLSIKYLSAVTKRHKQVQGLQNTLSQKHCNAIQTNVVIDLI